MIKIITVYNTLNPGSLLQATTLYNVLDKKYPNTINFCKMKGRHPFLSGIKLSLKLLMKFKFKSAVKQFFMPIDYHKILRNYKVSCGYSENDIYILGSDEIWNVSRKNIVNNRIFWGENIKQSRCISYAPSINNATLDDFYKYPYIKNALDKFYAISVRDSYSKETLCNLTDRDIEIVCDPTLLLSKNEYERLEEKNSFKNYILVYGDPSRFSEDGIEEILSFAHKYNKKVISYYFSNDWCDEIVYGSPYYFLALISKADYVITNTFHGTIFSLIYNKKFAILGENKKVKELVTQFKVDNKIYNNTNSIEAILSNNINYYNINKELQKIREKSQRFLFENIDFLCRKQNTK